MKNLIKSVIRNKEFVFVNIVFLIVAILVFTNVADGKREIATAILVTGISLSVGLKQLKVENDKIFKELFITFNERYDEKFNDRLNEIASDYEAGKQCLLSPEDKKLIIDYLNFCSEEFLWYKKNRIDETVWQSWRQGMLYYLNIKPINDYAVNEKRQARSYYGLFEDIQGELKNWN